MLKFCQMTGRGLANAAGQAVAMHCVRGRSGVTKPAPPGPSVRSETFCQKHKIKNI